MNIYITTLPNNLDPDRCGLHSKGRLTIDNRALYLGAYYISIRSLGWWLFYK